VHDETIASALAGGARSKAAQQLIGLALAAGTRDNVTVVVADVVPGGRAHTGWSPPS
jgi:serine/threonine protein phosphatase PrpC